MKKPERNTLNIQHNYIKCVMCDTLGIMVSANGYNIQTIYI